MMPNRVIRVGVVAPMDWPLPGGPATPPLKRSKRTLNAVTGEDRDSPSGSYDPDDSPQNTAQVRIIVPERSLLNVVCI